jgi:hypothetical protein
VFAVMLCRLRKGALLLSFGHTEYNISKAGALPCPVELEGCGKRDDATWNLSKLVWPPVKCKA